MGEKNFELKDENTFAITGFILSFLSFLSLIGFILSIIGLLTANRYKNKRKGIAIAGIIISFIVIISMLWIVSKNVETTDLEIKKEVCAVFLVDGNEYRKECVEEGDLVSPPDVPTKEGYIFSHWATHINSTDGSEIYDFSKPVEKYTMLFAYFDEVKNNIKTTESNTIINNNDNYSESTPIVSRYETIYNEYSDRLRNECPSLSLMECATIANEGVTKMAEYMYSASGTEGQYETYSDWATKLYDVYVESAR